MPQSPDDKFLREKNSLLEQLTDIAEYLGDEDAKQVTLNQSPLTRHVSTESANAAQNHDDLEAEEA